MFTKKVNTLPNSQSALPELDTPANLMGTYGSISNLNTSRELQGFDIVRCPRTALTVSHMGAWQRSQACCRVICGFLLYNTVFFSSDRDIATLIRNVYSALFSTFHLVVASKRSTCPHVCSLKTKVEEEKKPFSFTTITLAPFVDIFNALEFITE